jgi:hypothetical protein
LFDLLRRNCKDVQNFNHYLDNDIGHRVCGRHFCIRFEAFEKILDPVEEIGKGFFTCVDVLGSLTDIGIENDSKEGSRRILTKKRIPMPAEITFAGENICQND